MCSGGDKLPTNYILGVVVSSHHVQKVSCRECSSSVSRYSNGDVSELLSNCGLSRRTSIVTNGTEVVAPASLQRRDALQLLQIAAAADTDGDDDLFAGRSRRYRPGGSGNTELNFSCQQRLDDANVSSNIGNLRIAVHTTPIRDSNLVTRKIAHLRWLLCASPDYLETHGELETPRDLARHHCLVHINSDPSDRVWRLRFGNGQVSIKVQGRCVEPDRDLCHS